MTVFLHGVCVCFYRRNTRKCAHSDGGTRFPYSSPQWDRPAVTPPPADRQLSADHHVLIIEAADEALRGAASQWRQLCRVLLRAGKRWSYAQKPEGIGLGRFVVVMSSDTASGQGGQAAQAQ
ncbi:hypothetical protein [Streptomyces sp. NPDC087787]|uniref:hypothetical protein n=1 Tax=Streptomyces sp. NPDC087787 TaxID=3365803 RepID=UPI003804F2F0